MGEGDEADVGPDAGDPQDPAAGVADDPGGGPPVGPAHGFGSGPLQAGAFEAEELEPESQVVGEGDQRQPGSVGGQLLEREPLAAAVFEAGDVLLDPGVEAHVEVCFGRGGFLVGPVARDSGIRRRGTGSAGSCGSGVPGG